MGSNSKVFDKPTRTASTEAHYVKRVSTIIKKTYGVECNRDIDNAKPQDLSRWLVSNRCNYRTASFRQYRAALIYWLECSSLDGCVEALAILSHDDQSLKLSMNQFCRTSSSKDKKFSDADRFEVIEWLKLHPAKFSHALIVMLHIGGTLGLRPCEWQSASISKLQNSDCEIRIQNAKSTNGRSNGPTRTLTITSVDDGLFEVLEKFISLVSRLKWDDLYNGCRKLLHKSTRTLWPNRKHYPTLYSLRHQFSADAKSSGMSKAEVAALMGHASIDTATSHYGKKRVGRGKCIATPSEADVSRLHQHHNKYLTSNKEVNI